MPSKTRALGSLAAVALALSPFAPGCSDRRRAPLDEPSIRSITSAAAAPAPSSAAAQAGASPALRTATPDDARSGTSPDPRKASHFEVALVNHGTQPVSQLVLGLSDGSSVQVEVLAASASHPLVLGAFPCRVALRDGGGAAHAQSWDSGPCPHSGRGSLAIEIDAGGTVRWDLLHGDFFND